MGKERKARIYVQGKEKSYRSIFHKGIYDLSNIISISNSYLKQLKYDITDKKHEEKTKSSGREVKLDWIAEKKVSEYVKYIIELTILVKDQIDILFGKKKLQKGRMEVLIKAYMDKNYKATFKDSKLSEALRRIYDKFIAKKTLDDYEDALKDESNELARLVKEQFE